MFQAIALDEVLNDIEVPSLDVQHLVARKSGRHGKTCNFASLIVAQKCSLLGNAQAADATRKKTRVFHRNK